MEAKHVVSVSLGSSQRDHRVEMELLGRHLLVERRGADGDPARAASWLRELDGRVDVLALGGVNLYLTAGRRRYPLKDGIRLAAAVRRTPLVDGSGIKASWERQIVPRLQKQLGWPRPGQTVLFSSVLDRWPLAEALAAAGCRLLIGDAAFALGLPLPFTSLRLFALAAAAAAPLFCRLPIGLLYPTGRRQEQIRPRFQSLYRRADILAGDFHFLRRHLPPRLDGKCVLTSTVTAADRRELAARGVRWLVTTAPEMAGRSFGANVLEAVCVALLDMAPAEIDPALYPPLLQKAGLTPGITRLN
ncbi:quinate 5-dehydrogenase [Desulfotomaculum copahuensis]|uniref:Quinate 5-dehydrogenase n=1 Tax=Desulfotomaculum copahuensis TaxID=1838280 RepID=A0A1B7LKE1_9FIRM|nr:quinate 5-dehydrogenase [Desulfotomaculum copahuensis]OAT87037.1 quinate 5-dehydrogenase [Desulfotomaculum copahuensis]